MSLGLLFIFMNHFIFADSALHEAIDNIADEMSADLANSKKNAKVAAIVKLSVTGELTDSSKDYLKNKLESIGSQNHIQIVHCHQCGVLRAEAADGQIFIRKGITDKATLGKIAKELGADSYFRINFEAYSYSVRMSANLYSVQSDKVIWSQDYYQRTLSLGERGRIYNFGIEQGFGDNQSVPFGGSFMFSERFKGFGSIGFLITSMGGSGVYRHYWGLGPNFNFNFNEMFMGPWSFGSLSLDLAFLFGQYADKRNIANKVSLRFNFGTFYYLSLGSIASLSDLEKLEAQLNDEGNPIKTSLEPLTILSFGFEIN